MTGHWSAGLRDPLFGLVALTALLCPLFVSAQEQPPTQFRSRVVLVPIDVRVVDRDGNPVTDLRREEFTILEDGAPQEVVHFSPRAFTAVEPARESVPPVRRGPGLEETPANARTFLIHLGRGRLEAPANGVRGMIDFVKTRVLPQDFIAVQACGRATDFTTDHAAIIRLLERYKERHESIEAHLDHWFDKKGLAYALGVMEPSRTALLEIDRLHESRRLRLRGGPAVVGGAADPVSLPGGPGTMVSF
jgi:hypothetical protein